ncbi:MAG: hypothetical protein ACLUE2_15875 [Bacteroides cellulosilyticus]
MLSSQPLTETEGADGWTRFRSRKMSFSKEKTTSGKGSIRLSFPTYTGKRAAGSPSDPDYATMEIAVSPITSMVGTGKNTTESTFPSIPDCDGARVVNMNLTFTNDSSTPKQGYNPPSGSHLINLVNKQWNHCFLEIDEYQRDKVISISFDTGTERKD